MTSPDEMPLSVSGAPPASPEQAFWDAYCGSLAGQHPGLFEAIPWAAADGDMKAAVRAGTEAAIDAGTARLACELTRCKEELADVRERADFYEAERDRERLAAEHHRAAYVELEAEVAAERERLRAAVEALSFSVTQPGNGPQSVAVVPLGALLALLGPELDGDATDGSGEGHGIPCAPEDTGGRR